MENTQAITPSDARVGEGSQKFELVRDLANFDMADPERISNFLGYFCRSYLRGPCGHAHEGGDDTAHHGLGFFDFVPINTDMATMGQCHLCGTHTKLSFEHVPPKKAFNDRPLITKALDALLAATTLEEMRNARGKRQPKGAGAYTLCEPCNNKTGGWYGRDYVDWAHQALLISANAQVAPSLYLTFQIFPLRVIKQVACMFFSANPPGFQSVHEDVARFILNKETRHLPENFRIYAYFNRSDVARQAAVTGQLQIGVGTQVFSEISFPPLGYILSLSGGLPHKDLCDISFFGRYGYNTWTDVSLRIPVLPVVSKLPGDFRTEQNMYG